MSMVSRSCVSIRVCIIIGIKHIDIDSSEEVSAFENIKDMPSPKNRLNGKTSTKNVSKVEFIFLILITSLYLLT